MEARTVIDVDICEIEKAVILSVSPLIPQEIFSVIEEYVVPYNKEASAPEWIGEDPTQVSVLKWILEQGRWTREEVEECLYETLEQEENEEMRQVLADYVMKKGIRVSSFFVDSEIEEGNVRNVEYLVYNMRWAVYELNRFVKKALEEKCNDILEILLRRDFVVPGTLLTHNISNDMDVEALRILLDYRAWKEEDLEACLYLSAHSGNISVVECLLEHGVEPDIDGMDYLREDDREMYETLRSYRSR